MPYFSIVTPVYNPPIWALKECISSVLSQTFKDWEWCIADDLSTDPEVLKVLQKLSKKDSRVKLIIRNTNGGIVEASNSALAEATGDYVVLLDHDDSLTKDALSVVAQKISENPTVDYLYSDEDKIDEEGRLFDTFYKPAFSPERLRGQNYCCHLSVFSKEILQKIGGFRSGFDGAQDYDIILRATERARQVVHIQQVLYHWRLVQGSTATDSNAKPYAFESARKAVAEHCERVGIKAEVTSIAMGYVKVKRTLPQDKLISIVIPTRGDKKRIWGVETCLVANAVKSILEKSSYLNYEIILVHDRVAHFDTDLQPLLDDPRVQVIWYDKPFDFSEKCNIGVASARGEYIVLLNDDTQIDSADWLEYLMGYLSDQDVAMVGLLTVLEDGRIQSAGHGNNALPHNLAAGELVDSGGPFGERYIAREISGVTGACMALRRETYLELGGMSTAFPHSFNDVDLAFKALTAGYRIIWTPHAKIWHFESLSRDPQVRPEELAQLENRWELFFNRDQFTPHLA